MARSTWPNKMARRYRAPRSDRRQLARRRQWRRCDHPGIQQRRALRSSPAGATTPRPGALTRRSGRSACKSEESKYWRLSRERFSGTRAPERAIDDGLLVGRAADESDLIVCSPGDTQSGTGAACTTASNVQTADRAVPENGRWPREEHELPFASPYPCISRQCSALIRVAARIIASQRGLL